MTDNSIDRALGRLEGKVDLMLQEQKSASLYRQQTFLRLEEIDKKIDMANTKIKHADDRIAKVEEPVAEFSRWQERATGALMLISFVSATIGAIAAATWKLVVGWFNN